MGRSLSFDDTDIVFVVDSAARRAIYAASVRP